MSNQAFGMDFDFSTAEKRIMNEHRDCDHPICERIKAIQLAKAEEVVKRFKDNFPLPGERSQTRTLTGRLPSGPDFQFVFIKDRKRFG